MDRRTGKTFLRTFAVAASMLAVAWLAVDLLAHLDDLMVAAGPGGDLGRAATWYGARVARPQVLALALPIGLGSSLVALGRARRPGPPDRTDDA